MQARLLDLRRNRAQNDFDICFWQYDAKRSVAARLQKENHVTAKLYRAGRVSEEHERRFMIERGEFWFVFHFEPFCDCRSAPTAFRVSPPP